MPDVIRVVAAVIKRNDYYLICKRPKGKRHGDLWEFPGGKVEEGGKQEIEHSGNAVWTIQNTYDA